ncbi:MAG TPA: hypothetical protein VGF13_11890 [Verrucomicrobiae bacterium]|jgi:hypothetical protein
MTRGALLLICFLTIFVQAAATKASVLYVQVIRGTDREKPAGKNYREIGPKLSAKLSPVFQWKHYWEMELKKVDFDPGEIAKVGLAGQRTLEIEKLKSGELEVRLFRRSGLVTKTRQAKNGRMAILGGEESNKESFFVVVRPDEPVHGRE